jgi:hypothetical protein
MCGQVYFTPKLAHQFKKKLKKMSYYDCQTYLNDHFMRNQITADQEVWLLIHRYILIVECLVFVDHSSYFENFL